MFFSWKYIKNTLVLYWHVNNTHTTIDSFQSRDLEGKKIIELLQKRVNFSSANILITSQKNKTKVFLNKMQVLAIYNPY